MFDPRRHVESLKSWLSRPHVARWWGDPEQELRSSLQRPTGSHAVIVADDKPVGYLCWERPSREELEAVGLADLPEGLVDIDILIGETEFVGRAVGPRALGLLLARLREEPQLSLAGLGTSVSNRVAIRAYEKAGFRLFREFDDGEYGRCIYMVARLRDDI
jgi:aminoglycoside 6'-N-acetyltransferase